MEVAKWKLCRKVNSSASKPLFGHSRSLKAHTGCVNALAFDNEGSMLATGGDDTSILLWNAAELETSRKPRATYSGHDSNIFCISFGSSASIMYSCGNDGLLLKHDVNRGMGVPCSSTVPLGSQRNTEYRPIGLIEAHDGAAVLKVSIHPEHDSVVLSAGQDGSIAVWDFRTNARNVGRIQTASSQNCVSFNPTMPNLFLSCDDGGQIILRDTRMSVQKISILKFHTALSPLHSHILSNPADTSSVSFSPCGTLFGATFQKWYPTIYSIHDPFPLATLRSKIDGIKFKGPTESRLGPRRLSSEPVRGFLSTCTIKTGAFGGGVGPIDYVGSSPTRVPWRRHPRGLVFGVGSDDRRAYVWEVPPTEFLLNKRVDVDAVWDFKGGCSGARTTGVAFVGTNGEKKVPYEVSEEAYSVGEHRSIVNSVLFHPKVPLIKIVRVFSPFPFRDYNERENNKFDTHPRRHALENFPPSTSFDATIEDSWVLNDFDSLIKRESGRNTLWDATDDMSNDTSDEDSDDDDDDSEDSSSDESLLDDGISRQHSLDSWETIESPGEAVGAGLDTAFQNGERQRRLKRKRESSIEEDE
ncbi:WD40-repeat-containing domain protein [Obelidium mucronatum]|nr:WD40-repeat-containing domain protein [Obelidium mucronatum]